MNIMASAGVAVGIMIGLVICVIWFRFANTNKKIKTEYDERQRAIRNCGYRYAFYAILIWEVLMMILTMGSPDLPLEDYHLHFTGIILGCTVLGVYCVWKDAYWGLNNNRMRYIILFAVTILLNLIPIVGGVKSGMLIRDGKIGMPFLNIMVMFMLAVLFVTLVIKQVRDRAEEREED